MFLFLKRKTFQNKNKEKRKDSTTESLFLTKFNFQQTQFQMPLVQYEPQ